MTLKEKYCALIDSDSGYDNQLLADCCENVTDDFAIGFAEWCVKSEGKDYNKYKYRDRKELLEIYKETL